MAQRPPPFAALRALEAACRHRSYTAAAAELNVTHSAVSQSVRRLEEEVGTKLFHRRGSSMEPTGPSLALASAYAEASQSVGRAMRHISDSSPNSLTIRAPADVARLWLTPLLSDMALRFPDMNLCLRTDGAGDPEFDLAIQNFGPRPGFEALPLAGSALRAYASPSMLRRFDLDSPAALRHAPLLIEQGGADWMTWFSAAGLTIEGALTGLRFDDHTGLTLDAAVRGLGVALCDGLSAQSVVERGELVPVCAHISAPGSTLWAVWRSDHTKTLMIESLANWLCNDVAAEEVTPLTEAAPASWPALTLLSA